MQPEFRATAGPHAIGALAALVLVALLVASVLRLQRHPLAWRDELKHPVRHGVVAAVPVVRVLRLVRIAQQGLWPERLMPTSLILVALPAVAGLALLRFGVPVLVAWALWGMALAALRWVATLLRCIGNQPFGLMHWSTGFPLAVFTAVTLPLAPEAGPISAAAAP